jgi:hypothetical protein
MQRILAAGVAILVAPILLVAQAPAPVAQVPAPKVVAQVPAPKVGAQTPAPKVGAQAPAPKKVERFTGTTVNLNPGAGENLKIDVFRWSTDAERDALLGVLKEKGDSGVGATLEKAPTAGYIWDSGSLGYSLRYAQKLTLPDGGERIILVTDRPIGSWGREAWKATGQGAAPGYPFTLIELRLSKQGRGEGKMSLAARVAADADARTVTLENYAAAPVLINNVKRAASSTE